MWQVFLMIRKNMNLRQKLEKRFNQLRSVSFHGFAQALQDFWVFFDNEPILYNIVGSLSKKYSDTITKVDRLFKSGIQIKTDSREESVAIAIEILRRLSLDPTDIGSLRGGIEASILPTKFRMVDYRNSQPEMDKNCLSTFKERYLEKFWNYIEEQLEDYEMVNKKDEDFNNQQKSTYIQNYGQIGAVQTGNQGVANVNQNIGQNFSEILEQLAILKNQFQLLPSDEREEAIEVIDAIVVEVRSEKPSKGKIKSFLLTTKDFAVKTGTELAASTLAKLLESQMGIKG